MTWIVHSALLVAALAACGSRSDPCPAGTDAAEKAQRDSLERWCARPDGRRHGPYELRTKGWTLHGAYDDGRKDGLWLRENLKRDVQATYYMERGTGVEMLWYGSYQKHREQAYRDGVPDGPAAEWYGDGTLKAVEHWQSGKRAGRWWEWHPDGRPKSERVYEDNRLVSEQAWPASARPR